MSASSSPGTSPSKPTGKAQMPASVANASLEELQKLFVDSLKKLKARDKKISELTASQDNLQQQLSEAKSSIAVPATADADIEHQLQSAVEEVKEANHRATVAEEQFDTLYKTNVAQQQSLEEAASEKAMHAEQMSSLKEVLRSLAEDKELIEKELKHSQADLATAKTDGKNAEQQLAQLSESTLQLQQELQQAQLQVTEVSKQHQHELQALQALLVASQQELQGLQTAQESDQQAFSQQLSQVQANLDASKQSHVESSDKLAQFQSKLRDDSEQQASIDTLQQQHEEALSALRASLADVQHQLDGASQEKASMQQQLASAVGDDAAPIQQGTDQLQAAMAQLETEKQQHISSVKLLTDEVSLLKQELSSRESTPDPMPGDLQQQLDSAKADAAKQASKLAQAEMRASLVRQQLQIAQHQLKQYEGSSDDEPRTAQLQESLDSVRRQLSADVTTLQGRFSPAEEQASSSSSENGVMSNDPVRLVIKVGTDDSMPEPPSIFYAEQKRVKQKLSSLKAEKQQLQRQLSTLQETKEEYSAELQQCPELLAQARSRVSLLEQQQTGITAALHQSQQAESQLRKQLQESLSSCDALRSSLAESQQTCDKATFEAATLTTQLEAATADSDSLTQQLTSQQQAAEPLQQQCSNLQAELQNSQDRVTALQQELLHFQPAEIKEQHPASDGLLIKHQLQRVQTDRDALQLQVGTLQEALAKAQRFSTPPSPSGLTPPSVSQTPSPIRDEVALRGIKAIRAVLGQVADMQQSAEAEGSPAVLEEAVQGLEGAQAHAQELEDQIMAWQVAVRSSEAERDRLEEQFAVGQEAASKVTGLEAQLEQAVKREEQLRTSRAQCEYQLSQGGEEAQDLLKQVDQYKKESSDQQAVIEQQQAHLQQLQQSLGTLQDAVSNLYLQHSGAADGDASLEPTNGAFSSALLEDSPRSLDVTASQHSSVAVQQLNNIGQMLSSFRDSKRGADHTNSATQASAEDAVNGHQQDLSSVLAQSDADSAESTALRNEIRELSTEMAAAQQTAARLQEQCDGLKAQLVVSLQDAQQVDALKQELAEQHARLEAAEHDQTRNSQLTKEVSRLQQEVQTFKQQASSIGTLEQQCQELQADLAKAKYSTEQSQNQLAEAQAELQQKQQTTAEVDTATQHPTTSNGPGEEQHHTDDTADELQALRRQLIQLQSALADAQQQRQQQQQSSQVQLADAHAELEPSVQASTDDQASLQDELHKAQEQVAQLQEELAAQQTAGQAGISNAPSLTALPSMALSQSELGEAADDAIQEAPPDDAVSIAGNESVSGSELAKEQARQANEMADVKKKFMSVARRKQQEYARKTKELEDARAAAEQKLAHLQTQLDDTAALNQSRAAELAAAQASLESLQSEIQSLRGKLAQADIDLTASKEAQTAGGTSAAEKEQQLVTQLEELQTEAQSSQGKLAAARKETEVERERFKKIIQDLKKKIDRSGKDAQKAELAAAEARGKADAEKNALQEALDAATAKAEAEQTKLQAAVQRLEHDAKDYKARAHTLLRQKEGELAQARQSTADQFKNDLSVAEAAAAERQQQLQQAQAELESGARQKQQDIDELHEQHRQAVRELQAEVERENGAARAANIAVQQRQARCTSLEQRLQEVQAHQAASLGPLQDQVTRLQADYSRLEKQMHTVQAEADAFRATAASVAEAKDGELERVLASNARLRQDLASTQQARMAAQGDVSRRSVDGAFQSSSDLPTSYSGRLADDTAREEARWQPQGRPISRQASHTSQMSTSQLDRRSESGFLEQIMPYESCLQEAALLRLAERQAGREEELAQARQQAAQAQEQAEDLTQDLALSHQQVAALKEVCQELERQAERAKLVNSHSGLDLEYLKNIMLKLYETGESAALLPVLSTVLKFSPAELKRCQSGLSAAVDRAESQQTANARTAAAFDASAADSAGYLTGWTSWAFGGEPISR